MAKTLNPKTELMVLMAIKDKGELTQEELLAYLKEKWTVEATPAELYRYLRRWRKLKVIVANLLNDEHWVYSLRDIPWYPEAQMIHVVKPDVSKSSAKEFLENYEQELKKRSYIGKRQPDIRDYVMVEITFETVDMVAGGWQGTVENNLVFPRRNGIVYIPRNWLKGYHRWNARLMNVNEVFARDRWAYSDGTFTEQPKLIKQTRIGKAGPVTYEVIPAGTQFKFVLQFPTHGCPMVSIDDFKKLYQKCEVAPLRGLGAYDSAFGGRVKLVEMKET